MQTVMSQCKSIDGFHSIIRTPTTESRGKWKVMLKRDNLDAALPQLDEILSNLTTTPSIFPGKPHRLNIENDDRWCRPDYIEVCEAKYDIPLPPNSVWKKRPNIRADATVATQDSSQTNTSINDFKAEVYRAIQQCMETTQNMRVELHARIDECVKPQMQDTDLKVSNLADNITTLSDKLDTQLHATNERFSSVNARIQAVDDKLNDRMEQQFNRHKEEMLAVMRQEMQTVMRQEMQRIETLLLTLPGTMALQFGPTSQHTQHKVAPDSALEHDPPSDESNRAKRPKPGTPGRGRTGSFNGHASSPHGPPTEAGPSTPQPME
jgi:ribosome-associated translation inhibitor RaiA